CAPAQILGVQSKASRKGLVVKCAVAIVVQEGGSVVGKIRFEDIESAVAVIIADRRAHARLLAPIVVERRAGNDGNIGESSVLIVVIQNAGGAVACDKNVGLAVVVVIERGNAEAVMAVGLIDFGFLRHVLERAVADVVIKNVFRPRQSSRPAHHRNALPYAGGALSWRQRYSGVVVHVVRDHQIELAIAIVIHKRAARAPHLAASRNTGLFADIRKRAVAVVVVQDIFPVVGHVKVFESVVVVVAHAHALAPSCMRQTGFLCNVGEGAVLIVVIKVIRRGLARGETF